MSKKEEKKVKKTPTTGNIRTELKKVSWPSFKDIAKYSLATIFVVLIMTGFFELLNLGLSAIVKVVKL